MHKVVIFDFFDVIHRDPQKAFFEKHGYKREGVFAEASDKLDVGEIDYKTYLQAFADASGHTFEEIVEQFEASAKLDEAVVELIKSLRDTHQVVLLSNTTKEEIQPIFDRHNLEPLFHDIIISSEVGHRKPHPEIFHLALKRTQVQPHEAIFIDDTLHNVEGARTVGLHGIHFTDAASLHTALHDLGIKTKAIPAI